MTQRLEQQTRNSTAPPARPRRWRWIGGTMAVATVLLLYRWTLPQLQVGSAAEPQRPTLAQLVGIDQIEARLGARTPTGRGVTVAHIEGPADFLPSQKHPDKFAGVTFTPRVEPALEGGHATATATMIYGPRGLAPGVTDVHCYSSRGWMVKQMRVGTAEPPLVDDRRLFNHSWITSVSEPNAPTMLRRIDYLIDCYDLIMVAGVNNGDKTPVPDVVASAYNAIAVGHAAGKSSGGYTRTEVAGRCKPDIVAPGGLTSYATPVVTAVVARLLETADALPHAAAARRAPVIKAVLLAGAQKPENWSNTPQRPLHERLGAGLVRFDHSHDILMVGPVPPEVPPEAAPEVPPETPASQSSLQGWSLHTIEPGQTLRYTLVLAGPMLELSAALVWHRRIDGRQVTDLLSGQPRWVDTPRLANLDLRLSQVDDAGEATLLRESISTIDNVEHVYQRELPPGRYVLEVVRQDDLEEPWEFALAWRGR